MNTVLLTNAQQRKTLAALRSLATKDIKVIISEDTYFNPAAFSKYCYKFVKSPSPKNSPVEYYEWLFKTIVDYKCDTVFPMDDDTMDIVMKNHIELSTICNIPIPPLKSYILSKDKGKSVEYVKQCGIDCPNTIVMKELESLEKVSKELIYPVIIKPTQSSGSRGIRLVNNSVEFISEYIKIHKIYPYPIIQEYIGTGFRYDVCLLIDKNRELIAAFIQKELRHFPLKMGPSTLQESIYYPELLEMATKIMKKLPWYGIIELEFMMDNRDGKLKFMEINPRFWGSLHTSIAAGIDFPYLLFKLVNGEEVSIKQEYRVGIKGRWLLPGDLLHFITNSERLKMNPPLLSGKKHSVTDDIFSKEDPLPVLGFILACIKYVFNIKMWKLMFWR